MKIDENLLYDKIIMGRPQTIKDITFIPVLNIIFGNVKHFGVAIAGSISPKAFIVIDQRGYVSFYKLDNSVAPEDLIQSIIETCRDE